MKRKFLVLLAAALILASAIFIAASAAGPDEDFSIALDRAAKQVTVTGTGYAPNESVSLLAAYDAVPSFSNLDYIDQLKADEDGNLSITYPSRYEGDWLGGQSYYVTLNGNSKFEALYATTVKANPSARISIKLKETRQLDFEIDGVAYEFTSGNASIAQVNESGLIKPVRAGSTTITLKATDGSGLTSSVLVSITP
ncbi:MAG: hypothetical protein LBL96_04525 [Clostridiales bacterium]|nr:hypothetical protein [Clostridiales bacterium]